MVSQADQSPRVEPQEVIGVLLCALPDADKGLLRLGRGLGPAHPRERVHSEPHPRSVLAVLRLASVLLRDLQDSLRLLLYNIDELRPELFFLLLELFILQRHVVMVVQ